LIPVTVEMVREIYRGVLGREPESEDVLREHARNGVGLAEMLRDAVGCEEFLQRFAYRRSHGDLMYDGLNAGDEDLLRRYLAPGDPHPEFVGTFAGTRQRTNLAVGSAALGGVVYRDIPTVAGDVAAETVEYVGIIKAVEASKGSFVMAELGAGLGFWCVIGGHIARKLGRNPIRLYAVEASAERVENLKINFADNGFPPAEHTIVSAVVGPSDGFALFPQIDVLGDWGASAMFVDVREERPGYDTVQSLSIETLVMAEDLVDLLHFDIQGAEADVVEASVAVLTHKVRYMVIGTHGRDEEYRIRKALLGCGWALENEQPARFERVAGQEILMVDGTQVWRNLAVR
jgi:FkbM family methyltransferase